MVILPGDTDFNIKRLSYEQFLIKISNFEILDYLSHHFLMSDLNWTSLIRSKVKF